MAEFLQLGFGITGSEGDEFNLGDEINIHFDLIIDDMDNILVKTIDNIGVFDDDYDASQFIADNCEKAAFPENIQRDIFLVLEATIKNQEVDEEDEEFLEEELGCNLVIQEELQVSNEYNNCLFAYLVKDSLNGDVEIEDNKISINGEDLDMNDLADNEFRNWEDQVTVAITSSSIL